EVHAMSLRSIAPLLTAVTLLGCYESAAPIADRAPTPLDERLAGRWRCVAPDDDDPVILSISKTTGTDYDVVLAPRDEKPDRYRASGARLDGALLANVQEMGEDGTPGKWVLARYMLHRANVLELEIADEKAFKGESGTPAEIARRHLQKGDLFASFCVCVR